AQLFGQLQAAQVKRLHAWAPRGRLVERTRLLLIRVRSVVGADDRDHASPEPVDQSSTVGFGADWRKHLHRRAHAVEIAGAEEEELRTRLERQLRADAHRILGGLQSQGAREMRDV